MSMQFNPLLPGWLTALLALALLAAIVYGTVTLVNRKVARNWTVTLTGLRLAILVVFLVILLQPMITSTSNVPQLPELVVLIDTSQSMASAGDKGSRLQEVTAALKQAEFAAALKSRYRVHWFAFDRSARPIKEADVGTLKADGITTQIAVSIDAACTHARALGHHPQRVLLVSDGVDVGPGDAVVTALQFGVNVDVLAPTPAKAEGAPPIAIVEVQNLPRVLVGSETIFRVTLNGSRPTQQDRPVQVRISEGGKKIHEQAVVVAAGRTEVNVDLTFRPPTAGLKQYQFELTAGGAKSAKPFPIVLEVIDKKYEVLILEDRWRWDYKYLHRLVEDDPSFRFSALLNRGGGAFVQFGSPDRRVNLIGFPQGRADLEGFDAFILGDVNAAKWPRGLADDLARLVADDGRSLVVIAGPGLANLREIPELHALLPVELAADSGKPVEGPIEVRMAVDAVTSPFFFQLRGGDAQKLTAVDQIYPVLRKRAGATVLVEAVKHQNRIVVAEHTVGRGRVLFIATDTLWKWHTLAATSEGPTPYSIFWQQAFRAMTPARPNQQPVNLRLMPSRSRSEIGAPIVIHAEVRSKSAPATIQAFVTGPDEKRVALTFRPDPANPRFQRAAFFGAKAGVQRISASLLADGKVIAEDAATILTHEPRGEEGDIDRASLARIAHDTGGKFIDPEVAETWPIPDGEALPSVQQVRTIDLWGNFTLLLMLCSLLGADWFIRLFKGFVSE